MNSRTRHLHLQNSSYGHCPSEQPPYRATSTERRATNRRRAKLDDRPRAKTRQRPDQRQGVVQETGPKTGSRGIKAADRERNPLLFFRFQIGTSEQPRAQCSHRANKFDSSGCLPQELGILCKEDEEQEIWLDPIKPQQPMR